MSRKDRCTGVVLVLGTIVVLAAGLDAYAAPIRFDNPPGEGHFDWFGGTPTYPIGLDIVLDAVSQTGASLGPTQFHQYNQPDLPKGGVSGGAGATGEVQVGGPYGDMLLGVDFGDLIPSGLAWRDSGYSYYPGDGSLLPEGVETYLGVRFPFEEGGDMHYGWIGVVRTVEALDAFAWGYETEPGVSIAAGAPEPGTLAVLVLGGMALAGCRRRRPVEL